jgi:hypothetical protein
MLQFLAARILDDPKKDENGCRKLLAHCSSPFAAVQVRRRVPRLAT